MYLALLTGHCSLSIYTSVVKRLAAEHEAWRRHADPKIRVAFKAWPLFPQPSNQTLILSASYLPRPFTRPQFIHGGWGDCASGANGGEIDQVTQFRLQVAVSHICCGVACNSSRSLLKDVILRRTTSRDLVLVSSAVQETRYCTDISPSPVKLSLVLKRRLICFDLIKAPMSSAEVYLLQSTHVIVRRCRKAAI